MALASLKSEGETTTAAAALGAARDFDDTRRFEGVIKRVLIITGGQDSCTPQAADVIRRELQKRKIGRLSGSSAWMFPLISKGS
jgi:hypothetical protein